MTMNMEYFVIESENNNNYPLLEWDDDQEDTPFRKSKPVSVTEPIKLCLGEPVPKHPIMVDFHELPKPVVGERIKNVLEPLNIGGIQLIPAHVLAGNDIYDYWLLHVFNRIACVDREKSILSIDEDDGDILDIKSLVLDEKILGDIPLENRLVFVLAEYTSTYLFHQSIKDAIMAIKPEGLQFFQANQWGSSVVFG